MKVLHAGKQARKTDHQSLPDEFFPLFPSWESPSSCIVLLQKVGSNSAALGGAFRALHGVMGGDNVVSFEDALNGGEGDDDDVAVPICTPHKDAVAVGYVQNEFRCSQYAVFL